MKCLVMLNNVSNVKEEHSRVSERRKIWIYHGW